MSASRGRHSQWFDAQKDTRGAPVVDDHPPEDAERAEIHSFIDQLLLTGSLRD